MVGLVGGLVGCFLGLVGWGLVGLNLIGLVWFGRFGCLFIVRLVGWRVPKFDSSLYK